MKQQTIDLATQNDWRLNAVAVITVIVALWNINLLPLIPG